MTVFLTIDMMFTNIIPVQIVPDNYLYARVALVVKDKGSLSEEKLPELAEVLADEAKAKEVSTLAAAAADLPQ